MRAVLVIAALVVLAAFGWKYRNDIPFLRQAESKIAPALKSVELPTITTPSTPPPTGGTAAPGGLRRCMQNGTTLYTNEACPPGSKEVGVKSGTVSVVPGFKPPPSAASESSSGIPNARELLAPKGGTLKEKAMEKGTEY